MNNLNIGIVSLIPAYLYVLVALIISKLTGIKKEKLIFISSFRMSIQLILIAYLLQILFKKPTPIVTCLLILIMELFAVYNIWKRSDIKSIKFRKYIVAAIFVGNLSCIFYFVFIVLRVKPWYNPQYLITLGGMFIGNTMTALTLAINSLRGNLIRQKNKVEAALMLGARPKVAVDDIIKESLSSAIIPTMNSMLGMGIVFLPGMMTGQIISGEPPLTAIIYQITIMLGILGSVVLSTYILIILSYRLIFNKEGQLKLGDLN